MIFSKDEIRDLLVSIAIMTVIFSFSFPPSYTKFFLLLPSVFIIVASSVLIRELVRKHVAKRYGAKAIFKLWPMGSVLGLALMFIPIVKLVAVGSVSIYHQRFAKWKKKYEKFSHFTTMTYKEVGIITATGPIMHIILALFSWFLLTVALPGNLFLVYMSMINAWIALVSLIPIKKLDGLNIWGWKTWFWFLMIIISIVILIRAIPIVS